MRIATLSNAAVVHTQRWVAHFRARGHTGDVWSLEPGPPALGARPLPRAPLPGVLRYPLAAPALRHALAAFAPDVVDAHFVPNYGLLGTLAGRRPLVVSPWGSDLLVAARANRLQRARARFVLEHADAVIADSHNLAVAARGLGAPADRVHEIPWGVDVERFRPRATRERGLLLSTRMHDSIYDVETLIHAAKPLLERRPEARLMIAGHGRLTLALRRLAGEILPPGRFEFLGALTADAMSEWLARAEVYLSASRSDSTSISLLEAMASGAIPVVSDIEGNREWVAEGEGARLFRPGDSGSATAAIERALGDPAWGEAARARNRAVIETRADWGKNMARVEAVFASLSGANREAASLRAGRAPAT